MESNPKPKRLLPAYVIDEILVLYHLCHPPNVHYLNETQKNEFEAKKAPLIIKRIAEHHQISSYGERWENLWKPELHKVTEKFIGDCVKNIHQPWKIDTSLFDQSDIPPQDQDFKKDQEVNAILERGTVYKRKMPDDPTKVSFSFLVMLHFLFRRAATPYQPQATLRPQISDYLNYHMVGHMYLWRDTKGTVPEELLYKACSLMGLIKHMHSDERYVYWGGFPWFPMLEDPSVTAPVELENTTAPVPEIPTAPAPENPTAPAPENLTAPAPVELENTTAPAPDRRRDSSVGQDEPPTKWSPYPGKWVV